MAITEISSEVVEEVDEQQEINNSEDESTEKESTETVEDQGEESEEEGDESLVVSIEGEEEKPEVKAEEAPKWVKELRKEHRETVRELRELKAEKAAREAQSAQQKQEELGPRPKLGDVDIDYDEDKFSTALDAWHERKSKIDAREREARAQQDRANAEWKGKVEAHQKAAAALKVPDYEEAEDVVRNTFSEVQQGILIEAADNSALLAYVIGKRPAKAKELAAITNPIKFAVALAKLETQVKTTAKKTAPVPETRVRASAPVSGAVDSKLAKLMEEADRTGDRTKVAAYHRERSKQAA